MREAPPPPIVPARRDVILGGRAVPVAELRQQFPVLQVFVEETSFEDGDTVFPTQEEACRYVFRHARDRMRPEVEALNADIEAFRRRFPEGTADRISAFQALGSVIGHPDYVKLRLTPVDAALFGPGGDG
ncbi:MAG TPA: hypothetical protein VF548_02540 [Allosphingosinicella sp.]|jgi:hypothetical protein